jgi:uncharacterized membrane protein
MALLIAGLLLFTLVHLLPAASPATRDELAGRFGENQYRGVFSAVILASLVVIVFGWKAASTSGIYAPPFDGGPIISAVIFFASLARHWRLAVARLVRGAGYLGGARDHFVQQARW